MDDKAKYGIIAGIAALLAVSVVLLIVFLPDSKTTKGGSSLLLKSQSVGNLIEHFRRSGLDGTYKPKIASILGAAEGGEYSGDGFSAEIYLFDDSAKAESLEKSGIRDHKCHRNGRLVMIVTEGESRILPVFERF